ncbi:MAG: enoyl-CoA hydratase [Thermoleophilia bacterium]|jgi:enoyl-CoA hydratase/carnithine racemase|nr:enoyl-CoA hydratase [Thermoleophilia bacterium]
MVTPADHLIAARDGAVATITLNAPERRNALSLALMRDLTRALRAAGGAPGVRAVVIAATGPAFSAGHDLRELRGADEALTREVFAACAELMATVHGVPPPVIARVQGIATAAGCQLVAACDLAVAAEEARFATPGVRIGLFCSTPMVEVARAVGRKRAMEMLLTGDPVDARTAADWGLVNRVVPAADLEAATTDLARRVASASGATLAVGKRAFHETIDLGIEEAYVRASEVMCRNALTEDAQEGIGAFLEKREPVWSDR